MAAFPPPTLSLEIPQPLCEVLVWWRQGNQAAESAERSLTTTVPQQQLEQFLNTIYRHRGRIELNGTSNSWQTPYDCLLAFDGWRRVFANALSQVRTPPFFHPHWLTSDVIALRDAIAAERAFDRLPILADAVEEAGCDHPFILTHLRENADHAHHCWVVDLLTFGGEQPA